MKINEFPVPASKSQSERCIRLVLQVLLYFSTITNDAKWVLNTCKNNYINAAKYEKAAFATTVTTIIDEWETNEKTSSEMDRRNN